MSKLEPTCEAYICAGRARAINGAGDTEGGGDGSRGGSLPFFFYRRRQTHSLWFGPCGYMGS